jgi:hypothetical protein
MLEIFDYQPRCHCGNSLGGEELGGFGAATTGCPITWVALPGG